MTGARAHLKDGDLDGDDHARLIWVLALYSLQNIMMFTPWVGGRGGRGATVSGQENQKLEGWARVEWRKGLGSRRAGRRARGDVDANDAPRARL